MYGVALSGLEVWLMLGLSQEDPQLQRPQDGSVLKLGPSLMVDAQLGILEVILQNG